MIVKDEAEVIARCLDSVKGVVDEIIIVDTGPSDETKSIVKDYTTKIVDFKWIDDFSAARNFAFGQATQEYILWLDADGILTDPEKEKLLKLKDSIPATIDAVSMTYILMTDEFGQPTSSSRRYRLVKRPKNSQWHGAVHEF